MRPKPATMTGASDGSIVSKSGSGARRKRGIRNCSDSANKIGVASIDAAEINVASAARSADNAPTATAAPRSTKLNSLAWARAKPKRIALVRSQRVSRARIKAITVFTTSSVTVAAARDRASAMAACKLADIPTEMKKNPSSVFSNGAISACSSCRYSESDSITPARNAPRDGDNPAACATDGAKQRPHQVPAASQDQDDG